jgi:hypothetical protein
MAQFDKILPALIRGESVRREQWEPVIRMFVSSDSLMCQCGAARPWRYSLSWDEIAASDWRLILDESETQQLTEALTESTVSSGVPAIALANRFVEEKPRIRVPFALFLRKVVGVLRSDESQGT